jgi:hypothetical protein
MYLQLDLFYLKWEILLFLSNSETTGWSFVIHLLSEASTLFFFQANALHFHNIFFNIY